MASSVETTTRIASPAGIQSISLPYRDKALAKTFYGDVLGGELEQDGEVMKFRYGDFAVFLGPQEGGGCPPDMEWPHYAFDVTPDQYVGILRRLDSYGIPHGEPWMRKGSIYSLMYFRDPFDNQWELYSPEGCDAVPLRIGINAGGDYAIDFPALHYTDIGAPDANPAPKVTPNGYNHMTLATRDQEEAGRFFDNVFGSSTIVHKGGTHATTTISGVPLGWHELESGWTAPDAVYPHVTFKVKPEDLLPMKERLEAFGVPTHEIASHDGVDAYMFFRDPTGNLYELNCPKGFKGAKSRDVKVDVRALNYASWKDPGGKVAYAAE